MATSGKPAIIAIPIIPDKNFLTNVMPAVEKAIKFSLTGSVKNILAESLAKRVILWRAKPHFIGIYRRIGGDMVLLVTPSGSELAKNRWKWTSRGTKKKWRFARKNVMVFRKYVSKTRPGNVYGQPAPRHVGPVMTAKRVYTGVAPRHFEEHVVREERRRVINDVTQAVRQAVRSVK